MALNLNNEHPKPWYLENESNQEPLKLHKPKEYISSLETIISYLSNPVNARQ